MANRGRICWECRHISFSEGSPGYSEYTPGYEFSLSCNKDIWSFDQYSDGLKQFREKLQIAATCKKFEPHLED